MNSNAILIFINFHNYFEFDDLGIVYFLPKAIGKFAIASGTNLILKEGFLFFTSSLSHTLPFPK